MVAGHDTLNVVQPGRLQEPELPGEGRKTRATFPDFDLRWAERQPS